MKITHINLDFEIADKPQACGVCGEPIAAGEPYERSIYSGEISHVLLLECMSNKGRGLDEEGEITRNPNEVQRLRIPMDAASQKSKLKNKIIEQASSLLRWAIEKNGDSVE